MREPRIVFVLSPFQNAFFFELAGALGEALDAVGVSNVLCTESGSHEVEADDVFVLLPPHEYVALEGATLLDDPAVAARTIGLSAEQPSSEFFAANVEMAARLGATFDFSQRAVTAYQRLGVPAIHQPFGYVPSWDRQDQRERAEIRVPVLYLGNRQPRRLAALARAADALTGAAATLIVSDQGEPNTATTPTFLVGDDKRDLLAATGLLVNIHQRDEPYFEWLRFADAAHCGTPVLTERSTASEPFVDGVHFVSFGVDDLGARLRAVLDDPAHLDQIGAAAYELLRAHPLSERMDPLIAAATSLLAEPEPDRLAPRTRTEPIGRQRADPAASATWEPNSWRSRLRGVGRPAGDRIVAPDGTTFRSPFPPDERAPIVTCIADGLDPAGDPTLEGINGWEPWRLANGQHLGRVMQVDAALHAAARRWITEPWVEAHPHVAVQLFAVVHGIVGEHVRRPIAHLGVVADSGQRLPDDVTARCRDILTGVR